MQKTRRNAWEREVVRSGQFARGEITPTLFFDAVNLSYLNADRYRSYCDACAEPAGFEGGDYSFADRHLGLHLILFGSSDGCTASDSRRA